MESSICPKCKKKTVRYDIWDEEEVCENCGYVSGSCNLTNGVLFDGEGQRIGLQVSEGDSGMHAARMQLKSMGKGMSNEMWRELSSDSLKVKSIYFHWDSSIRLIILCLSYSPVSNS